ncbi:MAG: phenylacetate--CoA ligase family protein [Parcubacteria group bacterium]|jgi:phenylacetate-CoA ligase
MRYFLSKYIAPILWKYGKGSNRYEIYEYLKKQQGKSLEENIAIQKKKLYEILDYSIKNIPYYRKIARENNITVAPNTIFEDIKKFPILTKKIIRKELNNLINKKITAVKNTSGGSTGEPVVFFQDKVKNDWSAATKMFWNEWAGWKPGDLVISLWGSEKDILKAREGLSGFLMRNFINSINLNAFRMTKEDMLRFVEIINKEKPSIVVAYAESIYEFSRFIEKEKIKIHTPQSIISSAGTLFPEFRKTIERVFRCHVFNKYGSREVGDIACECEKHEGLHLNIFSHYLEILDDKLNNSLPRKAGDIYITTLCNKAMPLIRYAIGDIGIPDFKNPSCQRGFPVIESIKGRSVNLFETREGTLIGGEYFTHLFYFRKWVNKFQVIQKNYEAIEINVVLEKKENLDEINEIEKNIKLVMGKECKIVWKFVSDISPTKSGKFLYTISELNN